MSGLSALVRRRRGRPRNQGNFRAIASWWSIEAHAAQLGPELVALARLTGGRLALDMTQVTDFSCAWINAMIAASQHCEQFGGKLAIMSLAPRLESLLRETGLHRQLYLAGSVKEALQRFATSASRSTGSGLGRWLGLRRVDAA